MLTKKYMQKIEKTKKLIDTKLNNYSLNLPEFFKIYSDVVDQEKTLESLGKLENNEEKSIIVAEELINTYFDNCDYDTNKISHSRKSWRNLLSSYVVVFFMCLLGSIGLNFLAIICNILGFTFVISSIGFKISELVNDYKERKSAIMVEYNNQLLTTLLMVQAIEDLKRKKDNITIEDNLQKTIIHDNVTIDYSCDNKEHSLIIKDNNNIGRDVFNYSRKRNKKK